tara:strand:+ start:2254 stop:2436 length:183 start_codon:yes stop_codon:yes gene_type:complete
MNELNITSAKYKADDEGNNYVIKAVIGGVMSSVPLDPANSDFAEIMRQVSAGTLTIVNAD